MDNVNNKVTNLIKYESKIFSSAPLGQITLIPPSGGYVLLNVYNGDKDAYTGTFTYQKQKDNYVVISDKGIINTGFRLNCFWLKT